MTATTPPQGNPSHDAGTHSGSAEGIVLIVGATSAAGAAVAEAVTESGRRALALSRDPAKLDGLRGRVRAVDVRPIDATDAAAVAALHDELRAAGASVDAVVHLVGGWRESDEGIAGQSDDDWRFLEASLTALRIASREFDRELAAAPRGRLVAVSSTAVTHPRASNANYVTVKSAVETWMRAVADGFDGTDAAATLIVATTLAGNEGALGELVVEILDAAPHLVNGQRIPLR